MDLFYSKFNATNKLITINEIDELIIESNLRYEIIDSSFYNEEFDKNTVIEQIPIANKEVKKNRKIYLTINPSSASNLRADLIVILLTLK